MNRRCTRSNFRIRQLGIRCKRFLTIESLETRLNLATVGFTPHQILATDEQLRIVTLSDLDSDGDLDFVTQSKSEVSLYLNLGGFQQFEQRTLLTIAGFTGFEWGETGFEVMNVVDMDQDGDLDIQGHYRQGGRTVWFSNQGNWGFADVGFVTLRNDSFYDIDNDGDLDGLVLWEHSYVNRGNYSWHETIGDEVGVGRRRIVDIEMRVPSYPVGSGDGWMAPILEPHDVDGDGDLDFLAFPTHQRAGTNYWYENLDGYAFGPAQQVGRHAFHSIAVVSDFDFDGDVDVLTESYAQFDSQLISIDLFRNASGTFTQEPITTSEMPKINKVFAEDVDLDGHIDLVVNTIHGVSWRAQVRSNDQMAFAVDELIGQGSLENVTDLDGDGDVDVLVSNATGLVWWESDAALPGDLDDDGRVSFSDFLVLMRNFGESEATPELGDLDEDGQIAFSDFLVIAANFGRSRIVAGAIE